MRTLQDNELAMLAYEYIGKALVILTAAMGAVELFTEENVKLAYLILTSTMATVYLALKIYGAYLTNKEKRLDIKNKEDATRQLKDDG